MNTKSEDKARNDTTRYINFPCGCRLDRLHNVTFQCAMHSGAPLKTVKEKDDMKTSEQRQCNGKWKGHWNLVHSCSRCGIVERDGKWYCWEHDPERQQAKKKKRQAREKELLDERNDFERRAAMRHVCFGVSTGDLMALENGALKNALVKIEKLEAQLIAIQADFLQYIEDTKINEDQMRMMAASRAGRVPK